MRDLGVRARLRVIGVTAVLIVAPMPGHAESPDDELFLLRTIEPGSGALWYSATLDVPVDASYETVFQFEGTPGGTDACFGAFIADSNEGASFRGSGQLPMGNHRAGEPAGRYAVLRADPAGSTGGLGHSPVPPGYEQEIEYGNEKPAGARPSVTGACGGRTWRRDPSSPARIHILTFVAGREPILWSSFTLRAEQGVSVLAESWGTDASHLYREWDFEGGTYVHAGDRIDHDPYYLAPDALVAWRVKRDVTFHRRAVAAFKESSIILPNPVSVANPLVAYSIESPSGEKQYSPRVWADTENVGYSILSYVAGGDPGTYKFTIEALAAAATFQVMPGTQTIYGAQPYAILGVADVDFPPCSVGTPRDTPDDHPVCS